jgi:hypothetical protein
MHPVVFIEVVEAGEYSMKGVFRFVSHISLVETFQIFHPSVLLLNVFCAVGHANTLSQNDLTNKKATGSRPMA